MARALVAYVLELRTATLLAPALHHHGVRFRSPFLPFFVLLLVVAGLTIHRGYEVPFRGSAVLTGAAGCLLVVAYLSLGALLQLLARNLAFGLSLTGIICSPAFGFAGVGFPVLAMGGFAQVWGSFLPLRWYIQILFDQAARGVPPFDSLQPFGDVGYTGGVSPRAACSRIDRT